MDFFLSRHPNDEVFHSPLGDTREVGSGDNLRAKDLDSRAFPKKRKNTSFNSIFRSSFIPQETSALPVKSKKHGLLRPKLNPFNDATSDLTPVMEEDEPIEIISASNFDDHIKLSKLGGNILNGNFNNQNELDSSGYSANCKKSMDDYELLKVLGKGCMGKVLLAREKSSSKIFAIKSISKKWVLSHGPREIEHIRSEQKILANLSRHPFLVHLSCSFQSKSNLFLVLDYVSGGDIATQLAIFGKFSLERALFYTAEIIEGIKELHRMGIIYRDLKPENVLLDSAGHIKLTDFGLSKQFKISHRITHDQAYCLNSKDCECRYARTRTFCGTAEYLAPEVLLEQPYGFEVDWWSLGTFLYEMVAGVTPFYSENHSTMYRRVLQETLSFPDYFESMELRDLLSRLLVRNPQRRLGAGPDGAETIKAHPIFNSFNFQKLLSGKISAPYIPKIKSEDDVSWFDECFTKLTPRISPSPALLNNVDETECNNLAKKGKLDSNISPSTLNNSMNEMFGGYSYISSSISQYYCYVDSGQKDNDRTPN